jgi:hypothetical protein
LIHHDGCRPRLDTASSLDVLSGLKGSETLT